MKCLPWLTLLSVTTPALAIVNGDAVDWALANHTVMLQSGNNPNIYCTGTLIAGQYVITAAHCVQDNDTLKLASGHTLVNFEVNTHPAFNPHSDNAWGVDVALLTLDTPWRYDVFLPLVDHNPYDDHGQAMSITGFGGTPGALNQAQLTISNETYYGAGTLQAEVVNASHTTGGDSGAAWVNARQELIGIHQGSEDNPFWGRYTYSTNLDAARTFIQTTIDGWHFASLVRSDHGVATVSVQSLHAKPHLVSLPSVRAGLAQIDTAASSCYTQYLLPQRAIAPFARCDWVVRLNENEQDTLELETQGGSGTLATVALNGDLPVWTPEPTPGDTSSGGSMGPFSALLLGGMAYCRRHNRRKDEPSQTTGA